MSVQGVLGALGQRVLLQPSSYSETEVMRRLLCGGKEMTQAGGGQALASHVADPGSVPRQH